MNTHGDNAHVSRSFNVTVNPVEDTLFAFDDSYAGTENAVLAVEAPGVLLNDITVGGHPLCSVLISPPTHGALAFHCDGSFTYTPNKNFNREDSFSYRANDGVADSQTAMVLITVDTGFPWHNGISPLNVSDDKYFNGSEYVDSITPFDALLVINVLNSEHKTDLPTDRPRPLTAPFLDVSRDGQLTPFDVLLGYQLPQQGRRRRGTLGGQRGSSDGMVASYRHGGTRAGRR